MRNTWTFALMLLVAPAGAAATSPGLDGEVYGSTITAGKTEIEARYGRLAGGAASAQDALVLEAAHGFSSCFYGAFLARFDREPAGSRRLEAVAMESILPIAHVRTLGLDTAAYVEVEHNLHGPDNLETKLLLQHRKGSIDLRLNLIAEKALKSGSHVEFGYAGSAQFEVAEDISVGAEAFGDLGTVTNFTIRGEHFIGPAAKIGIDHAGLGELEFRAGFLFPLDRARDLSKGQMRFGMEYEF